MSERIPLVVHMSHEAGVHVGGVGAVLDGLLGTQAYGAGVARTLLAGPLPRADAGAMDRLTDPNNGVQIAYSSLHGIYQGVDNDRRAAYAQIEHMYGVTLLYGTRRSGRQTSELILIDAGQADPDQLNQFKFDLWASFGLDSARHDGSAEYNLYLALARPLLAAIQATLAPMSTPDGAGAATTVPGWPRVAGAAPAARRADRRTRAVAHDFLRPRNGHRPPPGGGKGRATTPRSTTRCLRPRSGTSAWKPSTAAKTTTTNIP